LARKRASVNMSGFWSAMPMVSASAEGVAQSVASRTTRMVVRRFGIV
jgi:hypothetical protein